MAQRDRLLDHIRRIALRGMGERQTDGQLLEHFISERDEEAFEFLLRRHGKMVWNVCHRVLGNAHDADDAFQATFLVLVRKADSVRPREAVGNWLYGVAYRTALEARKRIARRRAKEQPLQDTPQPESKPEEPWQDLWPILDRELSRLADKYRLPIVLCDLEGRSRKEVARQLAIPEGTLSSRLNTGRKKLAARMARHGFAIAAASLGTLLTEKAATASLSLSLLSTTTKAALLVAAGSTAAAGFISATVSTLMEGVLKTMVIAKIKTATLVLCGIAALGVGTGGVYYQTRVGAADSPHSDRVVQNNPKSASEPREREIDKLQRKINELVKALAEARNEKVMMEIQAQVLEAELRRLKRQHPGARSDQDKHKKTSEPGEREEIFKMEVNPQIVQFEANRAQSTRKDEEKEKGLRARLQTLDAELEVLEAQQQQLETQRKNLLVHRELLTADRKKVAEVLAWISRNQPANQPKNKPVQKPASGDKLDQILQRLDRLEKRLDRLEKSR